MSKVTEDLIQFKIEAMAARKILDAMGEKQNTVRERDLNLYRDIRSQNSTPEHKQ
jgi:hypothetical protein